MKKFTISCWILLLQVFAFSQTSVNVQNIINQVNLDSLISYVEILSGEKSVLINGQPTIIDSRNFYSYSHTDATKYLENKLKSYGLELLEEAQNDIKNVIGIKRGTVEPNKYLIICAHYDSMPVNVRSPGADDNASGTAAVIEAARIFSKYKFDYTILFALWDKEEYGLYGSKKYASAARSQNLDIQKVLNLDMIAYDGDNDNVAEIHTRNYANSLTLVDEIKAFKDLYSIDINLSVRNPGSTSSDHSPFWTNNYSAILIIEETNGDFHPFYHTMNDLLVFFNKPYFHNISKLAIGSTAAFAQVNSFTKIADETAIPYSFSLNQNYPNPFNPSTKIEFVIPETGMVSLRIFNLLGQEIAELVNETRSAGNHSVNFNAGQFANLTSGIYFYQLQFNGKTISKPMVLAK